jgi:large subunit ribosomal protein L13
MTIIVNAKNTILGRLASWVAKKALLGEDVIVVNAEKALLSGKKEMILKEELEKLKIRNIGNPRRGPFHQRKRADKYLRKTIRGMLPWKKSRGREAFKRIMVYIGMPKDEIKKNHNVDIMKEKILSINEDTKKSQTEKEIEKITLGELCNLISQ